MKIPKRKLFLLVIFAYVAFSLYAAYSVFFSTKVISRVHRVVKKESSGGVRDGGVAPFLTDEWNPWEDEQVVYNSALNKRRESFKQHMSRINNKPKNHKVQIWGKAAIGLYLWEHILEGPLNPTEKVAQWREGELQSGKIDFSFYTGPAVVQGHVPLNMNSLVVVLNGREQQKISYSTRWLEHVQTMVQSNTVSHVAVVLLGSEQCNNNWISPYLKRNGGFVELLFLVYDSPWVNDKDVFQWPLGVATYRQFPMIRPNPQLITSTRPYLCNFLGTVYKNSSRETLMQVLQQSGLDKECITAAREKWLPQETADTLKRYQTALAQSELTLCPVGINTECYRIYEACSYGSVPVVEDVMTPGTCATGPSSPLRLLKAAGAPFIFINDWKELPAILERERGLNQEQRVDRRRRLLEWYASFRQQMKERFTEVIEEMVFKSG
ncbi:ribitol-5-phosphate xylosyltransferase 1 [Takifugu flavidus]|uniref:UDP-D-xylose:ribitol-5-phosphate beta1,4-xylosyltransferase n=1 Tax=Takifugu flavidus TaxID=433684 RepID=A0A5C6P871_9TELE|nr:ribitol-5-phosphate xylosyltransferase 1 [Takifugu flavidus]TWW75673.1 UDP-D-xylose:ribitol-5-phosphate beta1,4-xylosyltransferase [Takifugu flavidus]